MKRAVFLSVVVALGAGATAAGAEEIGRVISSTPIIQQVAVPRQTCTTQPMAVQQPNSGAGAIMGGIAGGAIGNSIGGGSGRAAATMLGLVGGALLGNSIEGSGQQVQNMQQCSTQTFYENRTSGFNVVYEYAGKEFNVQMPYDPGPTIRLQVTPVGSGMAPPAYAQDGGAYGPPGAASGTPMGVIVGNPMGQPAMAAPITSYTTVYPTQYPGYYAPRPIHYGVPIGLSLNLGYSRHRHHGHRH